MIQSFRPRVVGSFLCFYLLPAFAAGAAEPRLRAETEYTAKLLYVVDGDTLKINLLGEKRSIRLSGVDTMESRASERGEKQARELGKRPDEIIAMGRMAKRFVEAELRGVKTVRFRTHKRARDRYGRILATVYLPDGTDLVEKILRSGFGVPLEIEPFTEKKQTYRDAYEEAMRERRGLWRSAGQDKEATP